jgi:hypothetical protein
MHKLNPTQPKSTQINQYPHSTTQIYTDFKSTPKNCAHALTLPPIFFKSKTTKENNSDTSTLPKMIYSCITDVSSIQDQTFTKRRGIPTEETKYIKKTCDQDSLDLARWTVPKFKTASQEEMDSFLNKITSQRIIKISIEKEPLPTLEDHITRLKESGLMIYYLDGGDNIYDENVIINKITSQYYKAYSVC